jgi:o-succinylbenzoate synthase
MSLVAEVKKLKLTFKKPVQTSRGIIKDRVIFLLTIYNDAAPNITGVGECAPLKGLSIDDVPDYEEVLKRLIESINAGENSADMDWSLYPSIKFGLETALLDLKNVGKRILWSNNYSRGKAGIPINGLIWMNSLDVMRAEADEKIELGFSCIKIKIGALDFDSEMKLFEHIRSRKNGDKLVLRADANGAFDPEDAPEKLKILSRYKLHSVEQPIRSGQPDALRELCRTSPIPIALDEELIGLPIEERNEFLSFIKPSFLVLKPNLLGGFTATGSWIKSAEKLNIGWWITSSLESNIGLNAIAQFSANYRPSIPQGLGTGFLYKNNMAPYTYIKNGMLWRDIGMDKGDRTIRPHAAQ